MIDLLFLAHNRLEFTRASADALLRNTEWQHVRAVHVYDDDSEDGTREFLRELRFPVATYFTPGEWGGPVAIMNDLIPTLPASTMLAKVDNDTIVPPSWLSACIGVMLRHPSLGLLGIEAFHPVKAACDQRGIVPTAYIGGIGLMRLSAFRTLPEPQGRFGFTAWQEKHPAVRKAWLNPALPVFLLDQIPFEPWRGYSERYVKSGWQRVWPPYDASRSSLWDWWC